MNADLFADRLATLRAERAKAERDLDLAHRRLREVRREHTEWKAVVERLTFAIAQLEAVVTPPAAIAPGRMDIGEAVYRVLSHGGERTVAELATAIDRQKGKVDNALVRLSTAGRVEMVPGSIPNAYRVRQAEEQRAAE